MQAGRVVCHVLLVLSRCAIKVELTSHIHCGAKASFSVYICSMSMINCSYIDTYLTFKEVFFYQRQKPQKVWAFFKIFLNRLTNDQHQHHRCTLLFHHLVPSPSNIVFVVYLCFHLYGICICVCTFLWLVVVGHLVGVAASHFLVPPTEGVRDDLSSAPISKFKLAFCLCNRDSINVTIISFNYVWINQTMHMLLILIVIVLKCYRCDIRLQVSVYPTQVSGTLCPGHICTRQICRPSTRRHKCMSAGGPMQGQVHLKMHKSHLKHFPHLLICNINVCSISNKHQPLSLKHVVCPHGPQPQHNRAAWVLIYKSIEQHAA